LWLARGHRTRGAYGRQLRLRSGGRAKADGKARPGNGQKRLEARCRHADWRRRSVSDVWRAAGWP